MFKLVNNIAKKCKIPEVPLCNFDYQNNFMHKTTYERYCNLLENQAKLKWLNYAGSINCELENVSKISTKIPKHFKRISPEFFKLMEEYNAKQNSKLKTKPKCKPEYKTVDVMGYKDPSLRLFKSEPQCYNPTSMDQLHPEFAIYLHRVMQNDEYLNRVYRINFYSNLENDYYTEEKRFYDYLEPCGWLNLLNLVEQGVELNCDQLDYLENFLRMAGKFTPEQFRVYLKVVKNSSLSRTGLEYLQNFILNLTPPLSSKQTSMLTDMFRLKKLCKYLSPQCYDEMHTTNLDEWKDIKFLKSTQKSSRNSTKSVKSKMSINLKKTCKKHRRSKSIPDAMKYGNTKCKRKTQIKEFSTNDVSQNYHRPQRSTYMFCPSFGSKRTVSTSSILKRRSTKKGSIYDYKNRSKFAKIVGYRRGGSRAYYSTPWKVIPLAKKEKGNDEN